jgi:glutaredoxin
MITKKNFLIIMFALIVFQKWDGIYAYFNGNTISEHASISKSAISEENPVIFFSKSWCGWCNKTRDLLKNNNVHYIEYDIEVSDVGKEWHKEVGGKGVPVLIINDVVKHGYNKKKILKLVNNA